MKMDLSVIWVTQAFRWFGGGTVMLVTIGLVTASGFAGEEGAAKGRKAVRTFCGSTPWNQELGKLFGSTNGAAPELVEWKLTLARDETTLKPARYELRCEYGGTVAGRPGLAPSAKRWERRGAWRMEKGVNPEAQVHVLEGAVSLLEVDENVLQILDEDRAFMVGHGGWSFTLNAEDRAEKGVEPELAATVPDMSYRIDPLASGANVFGVFEGRTPAHGIAKQLKIPMHAAATKAKWRVTLYQDAETRAPAGYKIEGTLFRPSAQKGKWTVGKGAAGKPEATVYELSSGEGKPPVLLLKGDENVLFFLDENRKPRVGHCEFSYTLNRRTATEISQAKRR